MESVARLTGEGQQVWLWGSTMTFKVTGAETNGAYAVLEYTAPPKAGSGLHLHNNEDEAFYILEGVMSFQIEHRKFRAPAGSYVLIPKGTIHAFVNAEPEPCKALVILTPAGLEGYFTELGEMAKAHPDGRADRGALTALAEKYNLSFGLELPPQG